VDLMADVEMEVLVEMVVGVITKDDAVTLMVPNKIVTAMLR
jgi:hypothetical protein